MDRYEQRPRAALQALAAAITPDPETRFAISLDRLAYAKDNHRLRSDLVRTFVRSADVDRMEEQRSADVATLRAGMHALTGRKTVLGIRYGELAVQVRDAGGSLFDFETDAWAREVTERIGASDAGLAQRIRERAA